MEISVIVTNFNYGKYLGRCLRSLLNQSLGTDKYEVICVDDGSTDESRKIIESFGNQIISVFLASNVGLASASNAGIRRARGRLIVRVDADDYVHPEFLNTLTLANELLGESYEAFALDYELVDSETLQKYAVNCLDKPIACGIAFKMEVLVELGFYKEGLRLDEEIHLLQKFESKGFRMCRINLPLYRYFNHSESLTSRIPR